MKLTIVREGSAYSTLEIMINTENRYSGIPTIRKELKKAGMPEPVFIDRRGVFKVIFYKKSTTDEVDIDMVQEIKDVKIKMTISDKPKVNFKSIIHNMYLRQVYDRGRFICPLVIYLSYTCSKLYLLQNIKI